MSVILFNGEQIFGTVEQRQQGPSATKRVQRSILPGVVGFRNYSMTAGRGPDTLQWIASGRILAFSLGGAEDAIARGQKYMNGRIYSFRSTGGKSYRYCELVDFRPVEGFRRVIVMGTQLITTRVQGTIEQASP